MLLLSTCIHTRTSQCRVLIVSYTLMACISMLAQSTTVLSDAQQWGRGVVGQEGSEELKWVSRLGVNVETWAYHRSGEVCVSRGAGTHQKGKHTVGTATQEKRNLLLGERGAVLHLTHETLLKGFFFFNSAHYKGKLLKYEKMLR